MQIKTLAQLFQEYQGRPVTLGDATVVPIYQIPFLPGKWRICVRRVATKENRVQGLRVGGLNEVDN